MSERIRDVSFAADAKRRKGIKLSNAKYPRTFDPCRTYGVGESPPSSTNDSSSSEGGSPRSGSGFAMTLPCRGYTLFRGCGNLQHGPPKGPKGMSSRTKPRGRCRRRCRCRRNRIHPPLGGLGEQRVPSVPYTSLPPSPWRTLAVASSLFRLQATTDNNQTRPTATHQRRHQSSPGRSLARSQFGKSSPTETC
jgi:hypothetical protein